MFGGIYICLYKVDIWNVNCAQATFSIYEIYMLRYKTSFMIMCSHFMLVLSNVMIPRHIPDSFYPDWYTFETSRISSLRTISQEAAFAALRPLMQEIVVESDLEVRMQQDHSINPSVIYTIFTQKLSHSNYT